MTPRPLREVDPATLLVLLPVALGPAAVAALAGADIGPRLGEATRVLVHRIQSDRATAAAVGRRLVHALPAPRVERTVAALGTRLREAAVERDHRGMAAVAWVAATTPGLAWRRLEERARDALVVAALWSLGDRVEVPATALAAK